MVTLRKSISTQLFRKIFGFYLLVTIIVTAIQMTFEYQHVREEILFEIERLPTTYITSLGGALWTYNERAIRSMMIGIKENPVVSGLTITGGEYFRAIGIVPIDDNRYAVFDNDGKIVRKQDQTFIDKLDSYEFDISYRDTNAGHVVLGTGKIFTSNKTAFERVKYGFILIVINSVVKTTALFLLFMYFMRKILTRPLVTLSSQTEKIDTDNLGGAKVHIQTDDKNELKALERSFNEMISKAHHAKNKLDSLNIRLEDKIRERTQDLENEIEIRKIAQSQAEEANKIKSNFIANISHEIRTPMTAIYGMARFIQNSELNNEQQAYADIIVKNCDNLMTIIEEILDFSKIESGHVDLEHTVFNLKELVENTVSLFQLQAKNKSIDLCFEIFSDVPHNIKTDKKRLRQVITNLVNNALKFTESGSISIAISNEPSNHELLRFSVSDTGIGIPDEQKKMIFNSFTQVDTSLTRKYAGSGLGLSICKHFVSVLGGTIWVIDNPNGGSIFIFTIRFK